MVFDLFIWILLLLIIMSSVKATSKFLTNPNNTDIFSEINSLSTFMCHKNTVAILMESIERNKPPALVLVSKEAAASGT